MASRFYSVAFVLIISILGFGLPSDLSLITAQAQTIQSRKNDANRLFEQGKEKVKISQFESALQSFQQALTIYKNIVDKSSEGKTLLYMGLSYGAINKFDKAFENLQQSLAIMREIKDRKGEAQVLGNLCNAYAYKREFEIALQYAQQALVIDRELRLALATAQDTIPNQLGKPTNSPTLRWVFQCFMAVHLVSFQGLTQVVNLSSPRLHILNFFSLACQRYYLLPVPVS